MGGRYLGAVDDRCLAAVYNACDIFVMPTRWAEMFGMAAVEAQACGKPVVASRLGGLTEALSNDTALFFEPNDAHSLAQAIMHLLEDKSLASRLTAQAAPWARQFSWPVIAERLRAVYGGAAVYR
jgi:glycosyltransferase involved in cell wall biosynthesis